MEWLVPIQPYKTLGLSAGVGMGRAGELAREMERVHRALAASRALLAALDQADAARSLTERVAYSPLRTLVEHAEQAAERVTRYLRDQAARD